MRFHPHAVSSCRLRTLPPTVSCGVGRRGFREGGRLAGKVGSACLRERDRDCRVPLSSLRDPVQAGSRLPEPEAVVGKPLALPRSPTPLPRLRPPRSRPPPASLQVLHLLRRPGPLHAPLREETMEVVPGRNRVEMPTVNASGSPHNC